MKLIFTIIIACTCICNNLQAQSTISGKLQDDIGDVLMFANVALYNSSDSVLVKVESTNVNGEFVLSQIAFGDYFLKPLL